LVYNSSNNSQVVQILNQHLGSSAKKRSSLN
jgi:hypothetical protein